MSLSEYLKNHRATKSEYRKQGRRSAVALICDSDNLDELSVLMIQRASREGDPWSGQMGFPGGKKELEDKSAVDTAKRETDEEVGVDLATDSKVGASIIGRLSDIQTPRLSSVEPMVVSPYVFRVEERPAIVANNEVANTVWVPLSYFADASNRTTMKVVWRGEEREYPCYKLQSQQVIWGMSLMMIDEMLRCTRTIDYPRWRR